MNFLDQLLKAYEYECLGQIIVLLCCWGWSGYISEDLDGFIGIALWH